VFILFKKDAEFFSIQQTDRKTQRPKIWMYRDKASGRSKGECTVTYDDTHTAKSAIDWFHNKEFMGRPIKVSRDCLTLT
jgi:RNA-binding protein FUS